MRLALLSDLHANLPALEACLADAGARGATHHAILGDLVGYGPHPNQVLERCRSLQQAGAVVLRGNHDQPTPIPLGNSWGDLTTAWTYEQLGETNRNWLTQLPLTATLGSIFLVHATAEAPEKWHYVLDELMAERSLDALSHDPEIRYVFGGHVHHQSLYYQGNGRRLMQFTPRAGVAIPVSPHRRWIATVGSVGQPRDGDTRANYALLDVLAKTLTFHRVSYDHHSVAREIRAVGLPEVLADRLERGR